MSNDIVVLNTEQSGKIKLVSKRYGGTIINTRLFNTQETQSYKVDCKTTTQSDLGLKTLILHFQSFGRFFFFYNPSFLRVFLKKWSNNGLHSIHTKVIYLLFFGKYSFEFTQLLQRHGFLFCCTCWDEHCQIQIGQ